MSMLMIDSFSTYSTPAIAALGQWQSYFAIDASNLSIVASAGRNGNSSLLSTVLNGTNGAYLQGVTSSISRMIMGFAINVSAFPVTQECPILAFLDINVKQVTVTMLPNGFIRFRRGSLTGTIIATSTASVLNSTSTYIFLEFDITFNSSTGAIAMQKNGVAVTLDNSTGLNTAPSGNNSFNTWWLGSASDVSMGGIICSYMFSDFYLFSTAGAVNNSFAGDSFIFPRFPTGAGASTQFTATGAASNWQAVNATSPAVPTPTTYVSDSTVSQKDLYTMTAMPSNTGTVLGVQLEQVSEKDASGARSTANTLSSSGTTADGATQALSQVYSKYLDIVELDPNVSGAWTKTSLNALQSGVKVAA